MGTPTFDPNAPIEIVETNTGLKPLHNPEEVMKGLFPNVRVTSTYRPPDHPLSIANPNSRHITTPGTIDIAPIPGQTFESVRKALLDKGFNIIENYDEVTKPSKHATGPHWHFSLAEPSFNPNAPIEPVDQGLENSVPEFDPSAPIEIVKEPVKLPEINQNVVVDLPEDNQTMDVYDAVKSGANILDPQVEEARNTIQSWLSSTKDKNKTIARIKEEYGWVFPQGSNPDEALNWYADYYAKGGKTGINWSTLGNAPTSPVRSDISKGQALKASDPLSRWEWFTRKTKETASDAGRVFLSWMSRDDHLAQIEDGVRQWAQLNGKSVEEANALVDQAQADYLGRIDSVRSERDAFWEDQTTRTQIPLGEQILLNLAAEMTGGVDPSYALAPGSSAFERIVAQSGIAGGVDAALQAGEISQGTQDGINLEQSAINTIVGGVFQTGIEGLGKLVGGLKTEGRELAVSPEGEIKDNTGAVLVQRSNPSEVSTKGRLLNSSSLSTTKPKQLDLPTYEPSHAQKVKDHVTRTVEGWENPPTFNVVEKYAQLPNTVRRGMREDGARKALGVFDENGTIHLIAENISSPEDTAGIVFHEALGHKGLNDAYQGELDNLLKELYRTNHTIRNSTNEWLKSKANQKLYARNPAPLARAVEEQLAKMVESGEITPSLWDKITHWLRSFGRDKLGLDLRFTDREIRSILGTAREQIIGKGLNAEGPSSPRYMYVGRFARRADRFELNRAKAMHENGWDMEDIRLQTGWFKAPDKQWRYEISDHVASFNQENYEKLKSKQQEEMDDWSNNRGFRGNAETYSLPLWQIIEHPELFKNYPDLRETSVSTKRRFGESGSFSPSENSINLSPRNDIESELKTLLHEIQHWVQETENFARGGNLQSSIQQMPDTKVFEVSQKYSDYLGKIIPELDTKIAAYSNMLKNPLMQKRQALRKLEYSREQQLELASLERQILKELGFSENFKDLPKKLKKEWSDFLFDADYTHGGLRGALANFREEKNSLEKVKDDLDFYLKDEDPSSLSQESRIYLKNALAKSGDISRQAYDHLFGEVEARDTANRKDFSEWDRIENRPYTSEDDYIEPNDYIFDYGNQRGPSQSYMTRDEKYAGSINIERLDSSQNIEAVLRATAEGIEKTSLTHEEIVDLARSLSVNPKKLKSISPQMAVAARQMLVKSAENLVKLGKKLNKSSATLNDTFKFQKALLRHTAIQEAVAEMATNASRVLDSFKIKVSSDWEKTAAGVKQLLKDADLDQFNNEQFLYQLARDIEAVADNPDAINDITKNALKPLWEDYVLSGRQAFMLSGWKSHVRNISGNAALMMLDNAEQFLASGVGHLRGAKFRGVDRVTTKGALLRSFLQLKALTEAATWVNANKSFIDSHPHHQVSKYEATRVTFKGSAAPLQIPYRLLAAEDSVFRSMIENANFYEYATRIADRENLTGAEYFDRVEELWRNPTNEMLTESNRHTSILQLIDEPSALSKVIGLAQTRPTSKDPTIQAGARLVRFAVTWLLPFKNVADRLTMSVIRRTPLAIFDRVTLQDIRAGGARRDLAIARTGLGLILSKLVWDAAQEGYEYVTGKIEDFQKSQMMNNETMGRKDNSILIGDKYYSLQGFDPMGMFVGAIATIRNKYDEGELTDEGALVAILKTADIVKSQISHMNFLEGIGDFIETLGTGPLAENARENFWANQAQTLIPAFLRQGVNEYYDPTVRDATEKGTMGGKIQGKVFANIPGLSETLPQKYDPFGNPLTREGQNASGLFDEATPTRDKVLREVARLSKVAKRTLITPATRQNVKSLVGKNGHSEVVQEFQRRSGQMIVASLREQMATPEWESMNDEDRIKLIGKIVTAMRKYTKEDMEADGWKTEKGEQ